MRRYHRSYQEYDWTNIQCGDNAFLIGLYEELREKCVYSRRKILYYTFISALSKHTMLIAYDNIYRVVRNALILHVLD